MTWWLALLIVVAAVLLATTIYDLVQRKHAILRNYPVIGHLRYAIERVGPELRQYIVTDNNEELPFSRDQRRWIYTTAKQENAYFGFGSDNPVAAPGHVLIKHSPFPLTTDDAASVLPSAKVLGARHRRAHAFRPASLVNISAMSFGSLSGPAIEALNKGAATAGCLHNTGEGAISKHHLHGGDLIYQVGTGYFGCRTTNGQFSLDKLLETVAVGPVRAIEIKLSQGAKPGLGGLLPAAKVTGEIASARGVPVGVTVASPARHRAFDDITGMVELIEQIATRLARGLDPTTKATRAANYIEALRHDLLRVAHAAGVAHPALVPGTDVEILDSDGAPVPVAARYGLPPTVDRLHATDIAQLGKIMTSPHQVSTAP